jgi:gamma-glutamyl-gamma-aminobutyrate hydrolase PuuD
MSNSEVAFLVGVTQRIDVNESTGEVRDAIDQKLFLWLIESGFLPVQIPNGLIKCAGALEKWMEAIKPRAVVLSGGNDINHFASRDLTERYLLAWCEKNRIPILGICRGLEMMALYAGSTLQRVEGHVRTRHELTFQGIDCDFPKNVNSYHNWVLGNCPSGFVTMALSEDGSIEAIKHQELPWEGWMWHPEREFPFHPTDTKRIKKLFNE